MGRVSLIAFVAGALIAPTLAMAAPTAGGWDFARWGMSRDELVDAAKGALVATDSHDMDDYLLKGRRKLGPFTFELKFQFDETGLAEIDFNLEGGGSCNDLHAWLDKTYGEPEDEADRGAYHVTTWRDTAGGNRVNFAAQEDGTVCDLYLNPPTQD